MSDHKELKDFAAKLAAAQIDLPHVFERVLNVNIWELYERSSPPLTHPIHGAHSVPDGGADTPETATPETVALIAKLRYHIEDGRALEIVADTVEVMERQRDAARAAGNKILRDKVAQRDRAERAEMLADKYSWQVRDTCVRAEKAEAELAAAKADLHNAKKSLARYQEVLDQNSDLKEQLAAAKEQSAAQLAELTAISDALGTNEGHSSVEHIKILLSQAKELNREIRYLRVYGNNDCTNMADDAMAKNVLEPDEWESK